MRILHAVLSHGFYGSERYCIELAAEQARAGHDVEVLIHDEASDSAQEMRKVEAAARKAGTQLRLVVIPGWAPAPTHRLFARRAIARLRPEIVHTHLNPAARRVGEVGQRLGVPHVSTLLIHYNRREHDPCDGLIALASWQRQSAPEPFRAKIKVVWAWIPRAVTDALAHVGTDDTARLRAAWGAADTDVVFGSVGRLMPEKGMDVLVGAFRRAFPRGDEPVRLILAGDGADRAAIESLAAADKRIVVAGARSDIAQHYRAFDVFVSAARFEPFGIAILEALSDGLPLVATRAEGPSEFVRDPRTLWAEPGDEATLASALAEAAARGRRRLTYDLSQFTPAYAAQEIETFYREILARRTRALGS